MTSRLFVLLAASLTGGAATAFAADTASAAFETPQVMSASSRLLGAAEAVSLSADGRYGFFTTKSVGLIADTPPPGVTRTGGIFRRDLETGELELVVYRNVTGAPRTPGALSPEESTPARIAVGDVSSDSSVASSSDGRYVAFTTSQSLAAGDPPKQSRYDVYVRDMMRPLSDPGAFVLASALDGTDTAPAYSGAGVFGSMNAPNSLSADGTKVAFTVAAESNIAGKTRIGDQAVVRDLAAKTTRVVSTDFATGAPARGQNSGLTNQRNQAQLSVQISADGSTVIWRAGTPFDQLPPFPPGTSGEGYAGASLPHLLWRRLDGGGLGPTRLVIGGADPDDPTCSTGVRMTDEVIPGPCDGPLKRNANSRGYVGSAAMNADGSLIAVAAEPNRSAVNFTDPEPDLYLVDMTPGLTRKSAARRLTSGSTAGSSSQVATIGVSGVALAPDASWLAFVASNWSSTLTPPFPVGEFPAGVSGARLYAIDLAANTIQLLGRGYDGGAPNGTATRPVISNNGRRVAFLTEATNFFWGDTDGATNAVLLSQPPPPENPPVIAPLAPQVPAPTLSEELPIDWRMSATGKTVADGTLRMTVTVPGAGQISVTPRRRAVAVSTSRKRARTQPKVGAPVTARADGAGIFTLTLRPSKKYRKTARTKKGLAATATVTFTPEASAGRQPLSRTLSVTFRRTATASTAQGAAR